MYMHPIEVFLTSDGDIGIAQQDSKENDSFNVINIHPDQVEILVKWLVSAKNSWGNNVKTTHD